MSTAVSTDASPTLRTPPGPGPLQYLQTQYEFTSGHQVDFMRNMTHRWGPISSCWLGTFRAYIVAEPSLIEEVLMDRDNVFVKDAFMQDLKELLGTGLLTSEGDLWRRQRKLAAPALQRKQIEAYADWMVDLTERHIEDWRDGDVVELHEEMMELTLAIVVKTLFNLEIPEKTEEIGRAIDDALEVFDKRTHTLWRFVPDAIPTHLDRKFEASAAQLDEVVYELIAKRRADEREGDDLLYRFLIANDEDGNAMSDKQLRDEVLTMFLAGHETTALAVTYAWFLLSKHPDIARRMFDEVDDVLGDERATAASTRELPFLKAIVQETMRMYSPAWIVGREATEDTQIGDYFVPKGTQVLTPQCVMHYDERYYEDPYEFRPDRWFNTNFERELPRYAYFPFGGGSRVCIGNHFAMMEAILMLATMAQSFDLENVMKTDLETRPAVTLRPCVPISMRLHTR